MENTPDTSKPVNVRINEETKTMLILIHHSMQYQTFNDVVNEALKEFFENHKEQITSKYKSLI